MGKTNKLIFYAEVVKKLHIISDKQKNEILKKTNKKG
ncbi:hypothetical protein BACCIP111883_01312 [Sutcliffiella rhizosphaerae]|uniref:Uncharacterized protein n=1 Tax=Sutcliffiella rhizosphaerae TaxID=2880967 RepID=A0ABM8YKT7_9BACI|nr:hypothetical protein BACCIP111883_01312 [Sutcliffiella rhizosphaerae]